MIVILQSPARFGGQRHFGKVASVAVSTTQVINGQMSPGARQHARIPSFRGRIRPVVVCLSVGTFNRQPAKSTAEFVSPDPLDFCSSVETQTLE